MSSSGSPLGSMELSLASGTCTIDLSEQSLDASPSPHISSIDLTGPSSYADNLPALSSTPNLDRLSTAIDPENLQAYQEAAMAALDDNQPFYTRHGENYACNLCDKTFNYKNGLIRHLRLTHGKEKPFECNICHRRFGYKNILMEHQNIHFGIKPYACTLCDKRFAARSNLVQHKLVHRKPYSCTICTKRFDKPQQLQRHILSHPGGILTCNLCSFSTTSQQELGEHMRENHGQPPKAGDNQLNPAESAMKLPQFGVAFNFPKISPHQASTCESPQMTSLPLSAAEITEGSRINSICAQLAGKHPPVQRGNTIKQEPNSPDLGSSETKPTLFYKTSLNMQMSSHGYPGIQGIMKGRRGMLQDNQVGTAESSSGSSNRSFSCTIKAGQVADSTSNVSEVLSLLHSLAKRSEEEGPEGFPQISITISPPRSTTEKGVQCTQLITNPPNLEETLAFYESQGKIYRCHHCGIFFEERGIYFLHVALHGANNPWECSICHSVFSDKNDFHLHLINQQHCQVRR